MAAQSLDERTMISIERFSIGSIRVENISKGCSI